MKILVTGGARSGKSDYALALAGHAHAKKVFIATAEARDDEMRARIEKHKRERGEGWLTVETPLALAETLRAQSALGTFTLVDCLTLWTSNLLEREDDAGFARRAAELAGAVAASEAAVVLVTNEVGLGIVPADPLTRRYRDRLGLVNAAVARACTRVVLMVAGVPLMIKGE